MLLGNAERRVIEMAHVVILGNEAYALLNFRGALIRSIAASGHHVTVMAAPASNEQIQQLEDLGAQFHSYPLQRNGLNPLKDLQTFIALRKAFHELKPDVLIACFIKPVVFGGLALKKISNVSFFAVITGLGYVFYGQSMFRKILRIIVSKLYQISSMGVT